MYDAWINKSINLGSGEGVSPLLEDQSIWKLIKQVAIIENILNMTLYDITYIIAASCSPRSRSGLNQIFLCGVGVGGFSVRDDDFLILQLQIYLFKYKFFIQFDNIQFEEAKRDFF